MGNFDKKFYSFKNNNPLVDNKEYVGNRKVKKFFRITIPILVLEIIAVIGLGIYLIFLPKNYCKVSVNLPGAVVYVNDKETKKFRMEEPKNQTEFYFYEVDISIKLPGNEAYAVTYVISCDKYNVSATTSAARDEGIYSMTIVGGEKTQLLSALTIKSSSKIKNFDISIKINVTKL